MRIPSLRIAKSNRILGALPRAARECIIPDSSTRLRIAVVLALGLYFHIIEKMKSNEAITALSALASVARLAVYRLLVKRGPEGYTPSELVERLDLPAPTLSFHLKGLVQAGLVVGRRDGRNLYYRPNFERMNALVGFLTENCCSLAGEVCGTDCQPLTTPAQRRRRA